MTCIRRRCRAGLILLLVVAGCASAPSRSEPPGPDRTQDPEFAAARADAEPEFATQADALAAGVYEPFVHPDSVRGEARGQPRPLTTPRTAGDPSTEELLGTLGRDTTYNRRGEAAAVRAAPAVGEWTLQMGAFDTEAGALVRVRELESEFPQHVAWFAAGEVYRVFLGRFADRGAAERVRALAIDAGYPDAWITRAAR